MSSALEERSPWPYLLPTLGLFALCVMSERSWRGDDSNVPSNFAQATTALPVWDDRSHWLAAEMGARSRTVAPRIANQEPDAASDLAAWSSTGAAPQRKPVIAAAFPHIEEPREVESGPVWGESLAPYTSRSPSVEALFGPAEREALAPEPLGPAAAEEAESTNPPIRKTPAIQESPPVEPSTLGALPQPAPSPEIRLVAGDVPARLAVSTHDSSVDGSLAASDAGALEAYLARLEPAPHLEEWVRRCRGAWRSVASEASFASLDSAANRQEEAAAALRGLAEEAYRLSLSAPEPVQAVALRRACDAVLRRAEFLELSVVDAGDDAAEVDDAFSIQAAAAAASGFLGVGAEAARWRSYLLLDEIAAAEEQSHLLRLAATAAERTSPEGLTLAQAKFLQTPLLATFAVASLHAAPSPTHDRRSLVRLLDAYEATPGAAAGRGVAMLRSQLAASPAAQDQRLAQRLEVRYRNANFRLSVAESLINQLLPDEPPLEGAVRDVVVGVPVRGRSTTYSQLYVDLRPSSDAVVVDVNVNGSVYARTTSSSGPAHLGNRTSSQFFASKQLTLDGRGVRTTAAVADASSRSRLTSLSTDFDGVPLVGDLVRGVVRNRHKDRMPQARRETEQKVELQATGAFDVRVAEQLGELQARFRSEVLSRLERLGLELDAIETSSTDDRAVARLRLADDLQLAAYTPRPRAPASSVASVQVHESAANNFLERLGLEGGDFSLGELRDHLLVQLALPADLIDREFPDDVVLYFSTDDPIRVDFGDGEIRLTLRLDGLECGRSYFDAFEFSVAYRLEFDGAQPHLVRDEATSLSGRPIAFRERMALHGVFAKMFPPDAEIPLEIPASTPAGLKLPALSLAQIVVDDGWLGLAVRDRRARPTLEPGESLASVD